jgi:hypothetical protein
LDFDAVEDSGLLVLVVEIRCSRSFGEPNQLECRNAVRACIEQLGENQIDRPVDHVAFVEHAAEAGQLTQSCPDGSLHDALVRRHLLQLRELGDRDQLAGLPLDDPGAEPEVDEPIETRKVCDRHNGFQPVLGGDRLSQEVGIVEG